MIPVPVAYENGYKLTPGSMSAVCCVIPTIVNEETGTIRLGMTYNEIYATMKQRPCFVVLENDGGLTASLVISAREVEEEGFVISSGSLNFSAAEATDYPVYTVESDDDPLEPGAH